MKKLLYIAAAAVLMSACTGAAGGQSEEDAALARQAEALYRDLRKVYLSYADSMKHLNPGDTIATDTTDTVAAPPLPALRKEGKGHGVLSEPEPVSAEEAMVERFERAIENVYKRYPADLDRHLSRAQNDSLWHYFNLYMAQRRRLGLSLSYDTVVPYAATPDTLLTPAR